MFGHIVWTYSLTRLSVLVGQAIKYQEPVLMVGDTGLVSYRLTANQPYITVSATFTFSYRDIQRHTETYSGVQSITINC